MPLQNNLLFVNKSARSKNLTRCEGAEKSDIFAHVQNPPTTASREFRVTGWHVVTSDCTHDDHLLISADENVNKSCRDRRRMRGEYSASTVWAPTRTLQNTPSISCESPLSDLGLNRFDPFDCSAVPMDTSVINSLKYYCYTYVNEVSIVKPWGMLNLRCRLGHASQCPELTYAVASIGAHAMYVRGGDPEQGYQAMQLKGRAMQHLQQRLDHGANATDQPGVATAHAISTLLYLESRRGDLESARIHYIALRHIIESMVDIDTIPLGIRAHLLTTTSFCSAMLAERPLSIALFVNEKSEAADLLLNELRARMQVDFNCRKAESMPGFFARSNQDLIGPKLLEIIRQLWTIKRIKHSWYDGRRMPTNEELQAWQSLKDAGQYDLLRVVSDASNFTPEQQVVGLALCLCCNLAMSLSGPPEAFYRSITAQMLSHFEKTNLPGAWAASSDLLLWALFVASQAAREDEQRSLLVQYMRKLKHALNIKSRREMEDILLKFLPAYNQPADLMRRMWEDIDTDLS